MSNYTDTETPSASQLAQVQQRLLNLMTQLDSMQSQLQDLAADPPEDWVPEQRSMRVLSYRIGERTQCGVFVFRGDVASNVNRWRGQLRLEPLGPAEVAALPELPVLGAEATYVQLQGPFTDTMNGIQLQDAMMLGIVAIFGDRTLTVKMIGPRSEVEPRIDEFRAFVQSLREE